MSSNQKRLELFREILNATREKQTNLSTTTADNLLSQPSCSGSIETLNASNVSEFYFSKKKDSSQCNSSQILSNVGAFSSSASHGTQNLYAAKNFLFLNNNNENKQQQQQNLEEDSSSEEEGSEDMERINGSASNCEEEANIRSTDKFLRDSALGRPISSLFNNYNCPSTCLFGRNCKYSVSAMGVVEEINSFWGDNNLLTTTARRKAIIEKLLISYQRDGENSSFSFRIGSSIGVHDCRVCESTYCQVIGMSKTNMWNKAKKKVAEFLNSGKFDQLNSNTGFVDDVLLSIRTTKHSTEKKCRQQSENCEHFIRRFGQVNGSKSPNPGEEDLTVLPVETVAQLFMEYWFQCAKESVSKPASKETFRTTFLNLKKKGFYKFSRGKGTFPTCDICNNANDLLASSKSKIMTTAIRDLIMDLKTHHLKQQAGERCALEGKKRSAVHDKDDNGNPILAVIFGDGMTSYAGRTPKYGRRTGKADGAASFENRVFGVEVYCGPVEGEILIHTDELVRGGANFIVEVQRTVIIWLGNRLSEFGMFLPKDIHLQWDNCGENKNKTAFMFNSLLVEMGYFNSITVGFLIIGHTHASIDQYFSCLRGIIRSANFIASPLALQHLFSFENIQVSSKKKKYRPPIDQIQMYFVHDYVSYFAPYRNKDIRGYGVPYQFRFFCVLGKAVCQYKQFSDSPNWLPKQPVMRQTSLEDLFQKNLNIIEDHLSLSSRSGKDSFMQHLGLREFGSSNNDATKILDTIINNTNKIREKASALEHGFNILKDMVSVKGIREQEMRRKDEEDGITHIERYSQDSLDVQGEPKANNDLIGAQTTLEMTNTKDSGFLIWINYLENPTPPLIGTLTPIPINPKVIWEDVLKTDDGVEEIKKAENHADEMVNLQAELEKDIETSGAKEIRDTMEENNSESDSADDYAQKVLTKLRESKNAKGKLSKAKKQKPTKSSNDRRVIVNAVASIKATAKYMLEKKLATNLVQYTGKTSKQLGRSAYWNKIVSTEDLKYFEARTTVEDILNIVDMEIKAAPEFQWIPPRVLSPKQLEEKEKREKENAEQFAKYGALYKSLLCRKNESDVRETVGRTTSDILIKRNQKDMKEESRIRKKKKDGTNTEDTKPRTKQPKNRTQSAKFLKLEKENEALEIEILQRKNATLKAELKKPKEKKKRNSSDDFNDDSSDSLNSVENSDSTCSNVTKKAAAFSHIHGEEFLNVDEVAYGDEVAMLIDDSNVESFQNVYFEETTQVTTNASEADIALANAYIALLKKTAKDQQAAIIRNSKASTYSRGRNSTDTEIFLVSLKIAVDTKFNFPMYKSNYLPLQAIFGVQLDKKYTIDQLSKKEAVRSLFLSDLVEATVRAPCSSSSSSLADIQLSSIFKTISDYKTFE